MTTRPPFPEEKAPSYRTLSQSFNDSVVTPLLRENYLRKRRLLMSGMSEAEVETALKGDVKQIGQAVFATMSREVDLAEALYQALHCARVTPAQFQEIFNEYGVSAQALVLLHFMIADKGKKSKEEILAAHITELQRSASLARYANDPKQRAKSEIRKLWGDWVDGKASYRSGAAFARMMLEQFPVLTSAKRIEAWVSEWRKERVSSEASE